MSSSQAARYDALGVGFRIVLAIVATLAIFAGLVVLIYQVLQWLQDAEWRTMDVASVWAWFAGGPPRLDLPWKGVQVLAEYVFASPTSAALIVVGVLIHIELAVGYMKYIGLILLGSYFIARLSE